MKIETTTILNKWQQYTLTNDHGMQVRFFDYGGVITDIIVPDRDGYKENVVLAYKHNSDYEKNDDFLGPIVGRVAGRIQDASFQIDGVFYTLEKNDGDNHLHGGTHGFSHVIWDTEPFTSPEQIGVKLTHTQASGTGGYPGDVHVTVYYTLNNANEFIMSYEATTTEKTPLTLTNHSYFNLSGDGKRTVRDHAVKFNSDHVIELDQQLIPTGALLDVDNTTFDFKSERQLVTGMDNDSQQHVYANKGYDHYFLFNTEEANRVVVHDHMSGRVMTITTDQPGMVMYTANTFDGDLLLEHGPCEKYDGVCFETQGPPASLHHDSLPNIILSPGETYQKQTVFAFSTDVDER